MSAVLAAVLNTSCHSEALFSEYPTPQVCTRATPRERLQNKECRTHASRAHLGKLFLRAVAQLLVDDCRT